VRAGLRHPVIKRLARAALPESELAALPHEENAELVKRLAEEIREAAYQRKMRVALPFTDVSLRSVERRMLGLRLTSARRQNQSQLVSASSDRSCVASKLLRYRWRTCLQLRELDQELDLIFGPNTRFCGLYCHRSLRR
jgi:predicted exporter